MSPNDLREPWVRLDERRGEECERELQREIGPGHVLAGLELTAVARCSGCDDTLFRAADGTFAIVQLTGASSGPGPLPLPQTTRFGGFVAVEAAMDQHQHWAGTGAALRERGV